MTARYIRFYDKDWNKTSEFEIQEDGYLVVETEHNAFLITTTKNNEPIKISPVIAKGTGGAE